MASRWPRKQRFKSPVPGMEGKSDVKSSENSYLNRDVFVIFIRDNYDIFDGILMGFHRVQWDLMG